MLAPRWQSITIERKRKEQQNPNKLELFNKYMWQFKYNVEKECQIATERTLQHRDKISSYTQQYTFSSMLAVEVKKQGMHLKDLICLSRILIQISLLKIAV